MGSLGPIDEFPPWPEIFRPNPKKAKPRLQTKSVKPTKAKPKPAPPIDRMDSGKPAKDCPHSITPNVLGMFPPNPPIAWAPGMGTEPSLPEKPKIHLGTKPNPGPTSLRHSSQNFCPKSPVSEKDLERIFDLTPPTTYPVQRPLVPKPPEPGRRFDLLRAFLGPSLSIGCPHRGMVGGYPPPDETQRIENQKRVASSANDDPTRPARPPGPGAIPPPGIETTNRNAARQSKA